MKLFDVLAWTVLMGLALYEWRGIRQTFEALNPITALSNVIERTIK